MNRRNIYRSIKNPDQDLPDYIDPIISQSETKGSNQPHPPPKNPDKIYDENGNEVVVTLKPQSNQPVGLPHRLYSFFLKTPHTSDSYHNTPRDFDTEMAYVNETRRYSYYKQIHDMGRDPTEFEPYNPVIDGNPDVKPRPKGSTNPVVVPPKPPKKHNFKPPASHTTHYPPVQNQSHNPNDLNNEPAAGPSSNPVDKPNTTNAANDPNGINDDTKQELKDDGKNTMELDHDHYPDIHGSYTPPEPDLIEQPAEHHQNPEYSEVQVSAPVQIDPYTHYVPTVAVQNCAPPSTTNDTSYHLSLTDINHYLNHQIHKQKRKHRYDFIH